MKMLIWLYFSETKLFAVSFIQQRQLSLLNLSCNFDFCITQPARILPIPTAEKAWIWNWAVLLDSTKQTVWIMSVLDL
jgi:hypothetical protein